MTDGLLLSTDEMVTLQDPRRARRVALVFHGLYGGGLERSMLRLGGGLIDRGFTVDLVVGRATGPYLREVPSGATVVELHKGLAWRDVAQGLMSEASAWKLLLQLQIKPLKRVFRRLPALADYFRESPPDAIFAADPGYNSLSVWAQRLVGLKAPVIVSERTQPSSHAAFTGEWRDRRLHAIYRSAYLKADAIVAVSDGVADDLAAYAGIPRQRITTVYNPVVGPDIDVKAREPIEHPWFAPGQPPVILGVGRVDPQKDFKTLIRAFARVRERRSARLVIIGARSEREAAHAAELDALCASLGVADDVSMPGFADNPYAYMARASVFVLSSIFEGLPGVLIQALACGCPVVSTDCPSGPAEILEGGRFGRLVPMGADEAMADAIVSTLESPISAECLRARAGVFSVERAVRQCVDLMFDQDQASAPMSNVLTSHT